LAQLDGAGKQEAAISLNIISCRIFLPALLPLCLLPRKNASNPAFKEFASKHNSRKMEN